MHALQPVSADLARCARADRWFDGKNPADGAARKRAFIMRRITRTRGRRKKGKKDAEGKNAQGLWSGAGRGWSGTSGRVRLSSVLARETRVHAHAHTLKLARRVSFGRGALMT